MARRDWRRHVIQRVRAAAWHADSALSWPDGEWGFRYDLEMVERFYFERQRCNGALTLTGSYLQDCERYPGFYEDVALYGLLFGKAQAELDAAQKADVNDEA